MVDDQITVDQDSEERYKLLRGGEHVADVVWSPDVEASRDKPEISEGKWLLSRVGAAADEELTPRPYGKDDADAAIEQAKRLLSAS